MKKKLILGFIIAALAFTTIGCGAQDNQTSKNETTESESTKGPQNETPKDTSSESTPSEDFDPEEFESEEFESEEPDSETESETTPPSEDPVGPLPFEGICWYVEQEGEDDPEFPIPDVKEGRYFDGTRAYYYYQYASEPEVYEYKLIDMNSSDGETIYYINLYRDGEQYDSDAIHMSGGRIQMVKDYGGFGGIYIFNPVDSLDGFYE